MTPAIHLQRAARHQKVGDALADAGDEWAVVCYFYSAYHLVRCALLEDPVFNDPTALQRIHPALTPAHRNTENHHGRQAKGQPREFGVNELVFALYRPITSSYERLHQYSIEVRYKAGLAVMSREVVPGCGGESF
jgi:hypothetical protein